MTRSKNTNDKLTVTYRTVNLKNFYKKCVILIPFCEATQSEQEYRGTFCKCKIIESTRKQNLDKIWFKYRSGGIINYDIKKIYYPGVAEEIEENSINMNNN